MSTLAFEGEACGTCIVGVDFTVVTGLYDRLHQQASTSHTDEVGHRSGKECQEVHRGAFEDVAFATQL